MKKTYMPPLVVMVQTEMSRIICGSDDIRSDKGIGYGGVDEEGELDPAARPYHTIWDDEEEEEDLEFKGTGT